MHEDHDWFDKLSSLPAWIKGSIALATALIGFIILFRENIYLSITVTVLLLLGTLFLGSIYVAKARNDPLIPEAEGVYRYNRLRPWAIILAIATPIIALVLLALQPSRSFVQVAMFGTPTPAPNESNIEQLLIGQSKDEIRLETTIYGGSGGVFVKTVSLQIYNGKECAVWEEEEPLGGGGPGFVFNVSDAFVVLESPTGQFLEFEGEVYDKGDASFRYPVQGALLEGPVIDCQLLRLSFDSAFSVPANEYSRLDIILSKHMKLIDAVAGGEINGVDPFFEMKQYPAVINEVDDIWYPDYFKTNVVLATAADNASLNATHFADCSSDYDYAGSNCE